MPREHIMQYNASQNILSS